ncbi:Secretory laccase, putative isoform 1 [Hibiscus syriacus]|uniref:Secretory laccase, putative isoform 1 n=1 Tax=Hibiscus syriacus TaxID=106335 RepID=A0A6A3BHG8_HIBSY|nr:laccase-14-like isoform X2 [Hibiscus syriacus]KAE8715321.1 Secretory laccase, putative isoform 1 [Hibiscus syriacus]
MGFEKQGLMWLTGLLFLNILVLSMADDHHYEFFLQESHITKLCSTKNILTVNGSFPGPEIRVRRGDTVFVNVHNQANSSVSITWEGIEDSNNGSNQLIQPGRNFTYQIELDDEIGTLWWHATNAWASATVHGAFVVLPAANEDYPFPAPDSDQTIIIGEWFRQELTEANQTTAAAQPDAYTINGHPGETNRCGNETTFEYQVDYQGLYIVRIINAVNETMEFGVASHSLTIIGQRGAYSRRSFTNSLTLAPHQVIDVLFCANQNVGHYYITARPSSDTTRSTTGILRYTTTST